MKANRLEPFIVTPPLVHLGRRAEGALHGERGILLGARRPAWVDVVELERHPRSALRNLLDLRFAATSPWDVVGLSLPSAELRDRPGLLLRELVPGDVVVTEHGVRIHSGTEWVPTRLVAHKKKGRRRRP